MTLEQMTHTCWRCRYGIYTTRGAGMECVGRIGKVLPDKEAKKCELFQPSQTACDFFAGRLQKDQRAILSEIYKERVKNGTF